MMISEHTKVDSSFATVWSKLVLIIHTYYFFTCFWFLSFPGWPDNYWLAVEIVSELVVCCDFILRMIIRRHYPVLWESMWLLHDKGTVSKFHFAIRMVGSIPTSLILTLAL